MATFGNAPADRLWIADRVTTFTKYNTRTEARAAAIAASAANSGAQYYTAKVRLRLVAPGRIDMPSGVPGPGVWVIAAATATTYLTEDAATVGGYSVSTANNNAPVWVSRTQEVCTGP